MKKFQEIRSRDNELAFEHSRTGKVETIEKADRILVTEKIDGANAQATFYYDGKLKTFSRTKELDEHNTLHAFYNVAQHDKALKRMSYFPRYTLMGEWLCSHVIKYKPEAYKHLYVFDVYDFETHKYLGYRQAHHIYDVITAGLEDTCVRMAPLLYEGTGYDLSNLPELQKELMDKSIYSLDGKMEGIVVSDLDKPITLLNPDNPEDNSDVNLRIKLVNERFKETKSRHNKQPGIPESVRDWMIDNLTENRIRKQVFKLLDEDASVGAVSFDWLGNGLAMKVSEMVVADALKETITLPDSLKDEDGHPQLPRQVANYALKRTNRMIALVSQGMMLLEDTNTEEK